MKPILYIGQGSLRPAKTSDLEPVMDLLHEASVRRYLCDDQRLPRAAVVEMLERSERLDADGLGLWIIEHRANGLAGVIALEPVSAEISAAPQMTGGIEPIIALAQRFEGTGLAREALAAVIRHAGANLRLERLVAAVDEPNERSHRLMLRVGFEVTGRTAGPAHELVLYARPLLDLRDPGPTGRAVSSA